MVGLAMAGKFGFPFFYPEPVTYPRRHQRYAGPYATVNCQHALPLTENSSAHPTSGGPYYWAAMLSLPEHAPLASWITGEDYLELIPSKTQFLNTIAGWFNLLGQVAVTTGIRFNIPPESHDLSNELQLPQLCVRDVPLHGLYIKNQLRADTQDDYR